MDDLLRKVIKVSLTVLLITHGVAFFSGMYLTSVINSGERVVTYQEKLANVTDQNAHYKVEVLRRDTEIDNLKNEVSMLRLQNSQISQNNTNLIQENAQLKSRLSSLQNDYDYLKLRYTTLETSCSTSKTTANAQTQSQVTSPVTTTPSGETYTPYMSYPPYGSRGTLPYPTVYVTATPNVFKFSSGLSVEEIVNKIRFEISYLDHRTEGYYYLIQYADETIVRGKGDCTDKALLLFSCFLSKGYSANDMGIATISTCSGEAFHDVLIMKNPPVNTAGFGKYHFDVDGETYYIIDPTNSLSTSIYEISSQYKDCLIIGNLYFNDANKGRQWVPYKIQ